MMIRIGRDPKSDFVVDNKTVSRRHATLEVTEGRIVLCDLGSKSGTYVGNGGALERITYMEVREHDVIYLGSERLRVGDVIRAISERNRQVVYERNPLTGEIIKK